MSEVFFVALSNNPGVARVFGNRASALEFARQNSHGGVEATLHSSSKSETVKADINWEVLRNDMAPLIQYIKQFTSPSELSFSSQAARAEFEKVRKRKMSRDRILQALFRD